MNLRSILLPALIGAAATLGFAQPNRIRSRIDNSRSVTLAGNVHPFATAANDQGAVDSTFALPYITLLLKPSASQQASLAQLTEDQQNPASPSFHQWLTPEQYADRFGSSSSDVAQITAWLQAQGFTVNPASRSRTFLTFSGTAGQVAAAFGAVIHRYSVNGQLHYANAGNPKIPAALSGLVAGFRGLHDFHPKPRLVKAPTSKWTIGPGNHILAPDDFATIYDITPMYTAGTNGAGQSIAIVGQSDLYQARGGTAGSDVTTFWSKFGITAKLAPTLVPKSPDPGIVQGDLDESSLDTEWAGAVARNATVIFVYSTDVWTSATYAVDIAAAPVLSMSYGECEMYDLADLPANRQLVQQANAEGITWLAAAGDAGATDCDSYGDVVAEGGLAVDAPGAIPEVTSMGGTSVNNGSAFWNTGNTATELSAKAYASGEETAWNDTAANGSILAGGGGASTYFQQPSWQTGIVPNDGWRHVPDLSFNSSVYGVPYYVYCQGCAGAQAGVEYVGGTSAATPTMAGVVALLNQYLVANKVQSQPGLGNINPGLYRLSQTVPSAFHDVTTGNNMEPCAFASPGCGGNGEEGYAAAAGYDSATGIGSVDVANLITNWKSAAVATGPLVVPSLDQNPVYQGNSVSCVGNANQWNFQLTLTEEAGISTTLTDLTINGTSYASQIAAIFGTAAIAGRQSISGCYSLSTTTLPALSALPANVTFGFSGSGWSAAITVPFQGPQAQLAVGGANNPASALQVFAPGMIMSLYGTGLGALAQSASTIPLPSYMAGFEAMICPGNCQTASTSYNAYLYYVGPNQVNMQIPYELTPGIRYDLSLGNPYAVTDYFFTVSAVSPGIFALSDGAINPAQTVSAGGTGFLFLNGQGLVTPLPQQNPEDGSYDGTAPAAGRTPAPRAAVSVTVGNIPAQTTYVGIPSWSVGVLQINFTIPAGVPSGRQPVVVTQGTTSSPPAYITIQ